MGKRRDSLHLYMLFYGIAFIVIFGAITTFVFSACTGGTMDSGDWDWKTCTGKDDTDTDTDTDTDDDDNFDMYDGTGDLFKQEEKLDVSEAFNNLKIGDQFTCKENVPEYITGVSRRDESTDEFGELDKFRKSSHLGYARYLPTDLIANSWFEKDTGLWKIENCANISLLQDHFHRVYTHDELARYYDIHDRYETWKAKWTEEWNNWLQDARANNQEGNDSHAPELYPDSTYIHVNPRDGWYWSLTDKGREVLREDFTDLVFSNASTKLVNSTNSFMCILHNWKLHTRPASKSGTDKAYAGHHKLMFKEDTVGSTVFYSQIFFVNQSSQPSKSCEPK